MKVTWHTPLCAGSYGHRVGNEADLCYFLESARPIKAEGEAEGGDMEVCLIDVWRMPPAGNGKLCDVSCPAVS